MTFTLMRCPFCGHQPEEENLRSSVHPISREKDLWTAGCVDHEGGCNAYVLAGSRDEAIQRWNTRVLRSWREENERMMKRAQSND